MCMLPCIVLGRCQGTWLLLWAFQLVHKGSGLRRAPVSQIPGHRYGLVSFTCRCRTPRQCSALDLTACSCPCLQVFKAPGKGWGVRCSVDLPAGAVLCKYVGVVITDE